MKAVLLAAGRGERLRPLTDSVPKCLVPVGGRPLLEYWLGACEHAGVTEVLVNTSYLAPVVERFLSGCGHRLKIHVAREKELLGTAGTLRANWGFVAGEDPFFFAHADNYTDLDIRTFAAAFASIRQPQTVLGAALFRTTVPKSCGIVKLDATSHVVEFHEKSANPPGNLANAAVYLGTPALGAFLCLGEPVSAPFEFSTAVIPRLIGRVAAWEIPGFLLDIGTPEQYAAVRELAPSGQAGRSA